MSEQITFGNCRIVKNVQDNLPYELWIDMEGWQLRGKYRYMLQVLRELKNINIGEVEDCIKY